MSRANAAAFSAASFARSSRVPRPALKFSVRLKAPSSKIYLLVESYFQERDYRRFGIDRLLARGHAVEVWEVFGLWKGEYRAAYSPPDRSVFAGVRSVHTYAELHQALLSIAPNDTILAFIPHVRATAPIFRKFARDGSYFGDMLQTASFGSEAVRRPWRRRTKQEWLDSVYARLPNFIRRTTPWRFAMMCGGTALEPVAASYKGATLIWGHALDYDIALAARKESPTPRQQHIVFLDQYLPFHPDFFAPGVSPPVTAEDYFPKLNRLFSYLENVIGLPVVIAAHPRASQPNYAANFGNRAVVWNKACELVRDAALIVTHFSTANHFTAIFRKPSLVATTGQLNWIHRPLIEHTARNLGAPLINLDALGTLAPAELLRPNLPQLDSYVAQRVKRPGTPEINNWEIFADHLQAHGL